SPARGFRDRQAFRHAALQRTNLHARRRLEDEQLRPELLVEGELLELSGPESLAVQKRRCTQQDSSLAIDEQLVLFGAARLLQREGSVAGPALLAGRGRDDERRASGCLRRPSRLEGQRGDPVGGIEQGLPSVSPCVAAASGSSSGLDSFEIAP